MKIKKYQNPSGGLPDLNIFQRPDGSYFYSNDGKSEINVIPLNKLTNNPAEWTYTDETGRVYTPKKEYKNTYTLTESNPTADYHNYLNLKDKSSRDKTMAKAYLNNGNVYDAFMAYIGMRAPKNPFEITGEPSILPGRATPQQIQQSAKLMETINNYWNKLGKLKIRLGGNGKYASGILTKPGTAPTTFNGQNISYITSPKGGNVTHKFYTDQGSEYILTKDGFARRIKTPHANTGGADAGLHEWNQGKTYFLDDKGNFSGQFRLIKEKVPNIAVATGKDGKMYFMNADTNKLILNEEIFPKAVEKGILSKGYYNIPYSQEPKLGYSLFEFGTNGTTGKINWYHPGSSVAFIEGLKQGGKMNTLQFLKNGSGIHIKKKNRGKFTDYCGGKVTDECIRKAKASGNPTLVKRATFADNARHFKHRFGGQILQEFKLRKMLNKSVM